MEDAWGDQRSAMFNAWKRKESIKQQACEHRWSAATPVYCLKCGLAKQVMDNIPRRNKLYLNTEVEKHIQESIDRVEDLGADEKLTEVVILLGQAKDKISDYVDEQLNKL